MTVGHNVEKLKRGIMARSRAGTWEQAKTEWRLVAVWWANENEQCECGHRPIRELCEIWNTFTEHSLIVGNVCVDNFMDSRAHLIFAALRKLRDHKSEFLNPTALGYFFDRGLLSGAEYDAYIKDRTNRWLSNGSRLVNERVLQSCAREPNKAEIEALRRKVGRFKTETLEEIRAFAVAVAAEQHWERRLSRFAPGNQ